MDPNFLTIQMQYHHVAAILGYSGSLIAGYGFPHIAVASLLCEVSSIFLDYKDMFSADTRASGLSQLNQLAFLVTYFFVRILLFPILVYQNIQLTLATMGLVSWFRVACMFYVTALSAMVLALNLYWFKLMMKGLKRVLQ